MWLQPLPCVAFYPLPLSPYSFPAPNLVCLLVFPDLAGMLGLILSEGKLFMGIRLNELLGYFKLLRSVGGIL